MILRFIINFFLFGLLFYLIYLFFPEAFQTLLSWVNSVWEYLKNLFSHISNGRQTTHSSDSSGIRATLQFLASYWNKLIG